MRALILDDIQESKEPLLSDITLNGVEVEEELMRGVPALERLMNDIYINIYMGHDFFVMGRYNSKLQRYGWLSFRYKEHNGPEVLVG